MNFLKNNDSTDSSTSLCFANFNQDFSSLVVGRRSDYSIHSLAIVHKQLPTLYKFDSKDVVLIERLFNSSLVAFVTSEAPSRLVLHHFKKQTEVCTYSYNSNILAVKINKSRLVICLEDSIIIHSLNDLRALHTIKDIPLHTHHTISLSPNHLPSLLAYPSNNHSGGVVVFDAENLKAIWTIEAHDSVLSTITFSQDGLLLATASSKGTVIRVFSIATKSKIYEFRRGIKRFATVYTLAFSKDNSYLACSSSTETVHIFKLDPAKQLSATTSSLAAPVVFPAASCSSSYQDQGWMDYLGHAFRSSTTYLPSQVSEVLNQERYFAVAKLPLCGSRNICGLTSIHEQLYLMVVMSDGILMVYHVDVNMGGECTLVAEHDLSSPNKRVVRSVSNVPEDDNSEQPKDMLPREQSPQQSYNNPQQPHHKDQKPNEEKRINDKSSTQQQQQQQQQQLSKENKKLDLTAVDSGFLEVFQRADTSTEKPQWSSMKKSYASVLTERRCCGDGKGCGSEDEEEVDSKKIDAENLNEEVDREVKEKVDVVKTSKGRKTRKKKMNRTGTGGYSPPQSSSSSSSSSPSIPSLAADKKDSKLTERNNKLTTDILSNLKTHTIEVEHSASIAPREKLHKKVRDQGELTLQDAVLSIEDLYLDAECAWLEYSTEFPAIISK